MGGLLVYRVISYLRRTFLGLRWQAQVVTEIVALAAIAPVIAVRTVIGSLCPGALVAFTW